MREEFILFKRYCWAIFLGCFVAINTTACAQPANDWDGFHFEVDNTQYKQHTLETKLDEKFITQANKHFEITKSGVNVREMYKDNAKNLWEAEDFKGLEDLLHELKKDIAPLTMIGEATQPLFYQGIIDGGLAQEENDPNFSFEQKIEKWRQVYPNSLAPDIALANYYYHQAFQIRGGDSTPNTSDDQMSQFHEIALKGYAVLEKARADGKKLDPQFYTEELSMLLATSGSRPLMQKRFDEGLQLDPDYMPLYETMANIIMPRWYGDGDDLASLAYFSAASHPSSYNVDDLYNRVVEKTINGIQHSPAEILSYGFSWPIIKSGYIQEAKVNGLTTWRLDMFCWLAVLYNDKPTAKILFDILQKTRYKATWGEDQTTYEKALNWANGKESENPLLQKAPVEDEKATS